MTWLVRVIRERSGRTYTRTYTREQEAQAAFDRALAQLADTHRRTGGRPPAGAVKTAYLEPVAAGEARVVVDLLAVQR